MIVPMAVNKPELAITLNPLTPFALLSPETASQLQIVAYVYVATLTVS